MSRFIISYIEKLLIKANCLKKNFKGKLIPNSMGIIYIINLLLLLPFVLILLNFNYDSDIFLLLIGIITMGFVGVIDDLIGNRETTGFRGHINKFIDGELTTGGLKAIVGGLVAIIISLLISKSPPEVIINFLLISLFTNFINLLDIRPGRAIKIYLFFALSFVVFLDNNIELILIITIGTSVVYLPYDIKGLSMIGDTGANSLGIILGIISTFLPTYIKVIFLLFLVITHFYAEKHSISNLITKNKVLSYIDNMGR